MSYLALFALAALALLLAVAGLIYRPPAWIITLFQRRWPDVLWQVSTRHKIVALTIDDGPSIHTEGIRAILKAHGAHATFFIIGSHVPGHEDALCNLVGDGHELANHAMRDEPAINLETRQLESQIRAVEGQLQSIYTTTTASSDKSPSSPPKYFRPGHGWYSTIMRRMVSKLGYRMVLGGVYPHDPHISWSALNAWHILSLLRPGAIITCHDGRSWTAPMLRTVLSEMKRRGYRVVTVTELLSAAEQ